MNVTPEMPSALAGGIVGCVVASAIADRPGGGPGLCGSRAGGAATPPLGS